MLGLLRSPEVTMLQPFVGNDEDSSADAGTAERIRNCPSRWKIN